MQPIAASEALIEKIRALSQLSLSLKTYPPIDKTPDEGYIHFRYFSKRYAWQAHQRVVRRSPQ
jgi:hypothetical protein